jgi:hypothetical protein
MATVILPGMNDIREILGAKKKIEANGLPNTSAFQILTVRLMIDKTAL